MPHSESVLPLGVPIAPTEPTDANPTHIAEYGRGGLHSVATLAARGSISSDRKKLGMLVWVESEQKYHRLSALPDTWVELSATASIPNGSITTTQLGGDITAAGKALLDDATAADQRTTLGLGTISTQDASAVALTGGSITGVSVNSGTYSALANEAVMKLVRKATAGTITKGQVVYIVGSQGTHLTVELADADSELTAATTIGVAVENITGSTSGYIITQGPLNNLSNLPIGTFANGAALWLSTTSGGWTTTRPTQPAHGVFLGWVVDASNGASGRAYIKVINGQELDELHDVLISGKAEKDVFSYDATAGLWKNRTLANAGIAAAVHAHAISDVTGLQTALDAKLDDSQASVTGLSILGAADAAAVRSTLGLATTDTPVFAAVEFANGERIRNSTNGRVEIVPQPTGASRHGIYFDMVAVGGQLNIGTVRSTDGALNIGKIVFDATIGVGTIDFAPGLIQETVGDLTLESVGGSVYLFGASVFINSYSIPGTIGTVGQVLTSNGTDGVWQTPASGGISEEDAIAFAAAL